MPPSWSAHSRLVNLELHAVALQRRRLASPEPEDDEFEFRWWTDLQFFVLALSRLRRYAEIPTRVASVADDVRVSLAAAFSLDLLRPWSRARGMAARPARMAGQYLLR
jgi:hypothetical protein